MPSLKKEKVRRGISNCSFLQGGLATKSQVFKIKLTTNKKTGLKTKYPIQGEKMRVSS